jgi:DNA repair exonuclease SbcCD nuclease subunit
MFRLGVYGDPHLSSKDRGAHRDYAGESFEYWEDALEAFIKNECNLILGLGDFSYGRFQKLEYRIEVEKQLDYIKERHIMLKGNHDAMTSGMSEFEYYVMRGVIQELKSGEVREYEGVKVQFFNYGDELKIQDGVKVVFAHDYYTFDGMQMPIYGEAKRLEDYDLKDVEYIICGHIHKSHAFQKGTVAITYLGCPARPSYIEGNMDEKMFLGFLDFEDGEVEYNIMEIPLWDIDQSFNLDEIERERRKKEAKINRQGLTQDLKNLSAKKVVFDTPEAMIDSLEGVEEKYKKAAKALLEGD